MQKIEVILKVGRRLKYVTREQDGHSFYIELFPNIVNGGYAWHINNSSDKEKWGNERDLYVAHSGSKRYKLLQECLPDIEQKVLEIYNEDIRLELEYAPNNIDTGYPNGAPGK